MLKPCAVDGSTEIDVDMGIRLLYELDAISERALEGVGAVGIIYRRLASRCGVVVRTVGDGDYIDLVEVYLGECFIVSYEIGRKCRISVIEGKSSLLI